MTEEAGTGPERAGPEHTAPGRLQNGGGISLTWRGGEGGRKQGEQSPKLRSSVWRPRAHTQRSAQDARLEGPGTESASRAGRGPRCPLPPAKPAGQAQKTGRLLLRSRASPPTRWACTPTTGARLLTDVTRAWTYGRDVTATQGMQLDNKNRSHNDKSCFVWRKETFAVSRLHAHVYTRAHTHTHVHKHAHTQVYCSWKPTLPSYVERNLRALQNHFGERLPVSQPACSD